MTGRVSYLGEGAMVACTLIYAIEALCAKVVEVTVPSLELVTFRSVVAGMLTLMVSFKMNRNLSWRERFFGRAWKLVVARGLLGGVAFSFLYSALHYIDIGEQTALFFSYPVLISTFALPVLGERAGPAILFALACGCLGTLVVSRGHRRNDTNDNSSRNHVIGVTLTLLASVFTAFAYLAIRVAGKRASPLTLAFAFHFSSSLIGIAGLLFGPQRFRMPSLKEDLPLMCLVSCTSLLGQPLLNYAYRAMPASRAASLNYLQVLFGFLLGAAFLHERPGGLEIAGAVLISCGGLVVAYGKKQETIASPTISYDSIALSPTSKQQYNIIHPPRSSPSNSVEL